MKRYRMTALITGLLALIAVLAVPAVSAAISERGRTDIVEFDVAEDMSRFIFNQDIAFEDGLPADGSNFITRGYLYPKGTISCDDNGCTGTNADGSPQYPDKVLGEWICEGYMINDAGHATGGKWVFSTQFFEWNDGSATQSLVTQGYELADQNVAISRAITGGIGSYKDARGDSEQVMLGLNASEGVALRVKLNARTR
jgi:hypothetical protein